MRVYYRKHKLNLIQYEKGSFISSVVIAFSIVRGSFDWRQAGTAHRMGEWQGGERGEFVSGKVDQQSQIIITIRTR